MALPLGAWAQEAALLTLVAPDGRRIVLDAAAMDALPQQELRTRTVWTEGPQTFGGVALRDVLALAGSEADLKPRTLVLHALNDYEITVPAADAWSFPCIIARSQNGSPLSRRDKGPLWLVYPRDADPVLQDQRYDQRWVWQLSEIVIA